MCYVFIFTIIFALHVWCLANPAPTMIIPVFDDWMAMLLIALMSEDTQ